MSQKPRNFGIDFVKGVAVIAMILFHLTYDLTQFAVNQRPIFLFPQLYWKIAPVLIGGTFLFMTGVTLGFQLQTTDEKNAHAFKILIFRFGKVFLYALGITVVTLLFLPNSPVYFGILHCISVGGFIIGALSIFFRRHGVKARSQNLILLSIGLLFIGLPYCNGLPEVDFRSSVSVFSILQIALGLAVAIKVSMSDYFPLFPFLAFLVFGTLLKFLFETQTLISTQRSFPRVTQRIAYLGKHSLLVYLLHQPLLLILLWALGFITP